MNSRRLLWNGFLRSRDRFATRPAVEVAGCELTYEQLAHKAMSFAATIQQTVSSAEIALTAVFAYRSETAYAGVLGALLAGHGYVPLNRTFPIERTRVMFRRSMCGSIIVDAGSAPQLPALLDGISNSLTIICPDDNKIATLQRDFPGHKFLADDNLCGANTWKAVETSEEAIAYLLFTSGSTGEPKGVMVSHRNVVHYVDYVSSRYGFNADDRVSQTFDMTFDLSAHDMFVAWENGACVCCPTQKQLIKPAAFIKDSRLTVWFSVPATAVFMRRLGVLKEKMYPELRLTLFCGEALPIETVLAWAKAAPNSKIENLYGPTELTIACTGYQWKGERSVTDCEHGMVPIGEPFEDMSAIIADEQLRQVDDGDAGELLVTGPQLSRGYWRDPEKTARSFINLGGETYYRTGDRVRRRTTGAPLVWLGRVDNQIKVLGHRVELAEVESVAREIARIDGVIAIGCPPGQSSADWIEIFLETEAFPSEALIEELKTRLPAYMVPRTVHCVPRFPLNANGKRDRRALASLVENRSQ